MRVLRKPDAASIVSFLDGLRGQSWLGTQRVRWPDYIWHYSSIENVARILKLGRLYSREQLVARGIQGADIAQQDIIGQSAWCHPYVRLYFRPRTPTQHSIEGIRRGAEIGRAHCPIPVFLLFDSKDLLTRLGCEFTDRNFARHDYAHGESAAFLRSLPFRDIYHDSGFGGLTEERKRELIGARCAEVLFRDSLGLDALEEIVCRTPAEQSTLLRLLGEDAKKWRGMIRVEKQNERMFHREYTYITEVRLLEDGVLLEFAFRPGDPIPYVAKLTDDDGRERTYTGEIGGVRKKLNLKEPLNRVWVEVKLDGHLAYLGRPSRQSVF